MDLEQCKKGINQLDFVVCSLHIDLSTQKVIPSLFSVLFFSFSFFLIILYVTGHDFALALK